MKYSLPSNLVCEICKDPILQKDAVSETHSIEGEIHYYHYKCKHPGAVKYERKKN